VESLDIGPGTRGGSSNSNLYSLFYLHVGRSGSGCMSGKSPRTIESAAALKHSQSVASSVFTGAVESNISGTNRNRRISQKVLDRI
jgi:hypothetical protein